MVFESRLVSTAYVGAEMNSWPVSHTFRMDTANLKVTELFTATGSRKGRDLHLPLSVVYKSTWVSVLWGFSHQVGPRAEYDRFLGICTVDGKVPHDKDISLVSSILIWCQFKKLKSGGMTI
jgi:hypothetical protein